MTEIVCVKVENIRPRYNDLEIWCQDCNNVYIGPKNMVSIKGVSNYPKEDSLWMNPFKPDQYNDEGLTNMLNQYYVYIYKKIYNENLHNQLERLRNKKLGCWCKPGYKYCHGNVLLYLLDITKK